MTHSSASVAAAALLLLSACATDPPCDAAGTLYPNLSPFRLCDHEVEAAPKSYNVQLTNHGCEDVQVTGAEIRGDTRCSFSAPEIAPGSDSLGPGQSTFVRFDYRPKTHGRDQVALVVLSDAANFPELVVPVCGLGVDASLTGGACTGNDDCVDGLECFYDGSARCDGTQPADAVCTCQPICPLCQAPQGAGVQQCDEGT